MRIAITILLACIASNLALAEDLEQCVPRSKIDDLRRNLVSQQQKYQSEAQQYLSVEKQKLDALKEVQECQSGRNSIDDAFDALTFTQPKCNSLIRQYNFLHLQSQNLEKMVEFRRIQLTTGLSTLRSLQAQACPG